MTVTSNTNKSGQSGPERNGNEEVTCHFPPKLQIHFSVTSLQNTQSVPSEHFRQGVIFFRKNLRIK